MTTEDLVGTKPAVAAEPASRATPVATSGRRKPRSKRAKPIKKATIVAHRWTSLVLGLALLLITTSGAAVVYTPEWLTWTNSSVFNSTPSDQPISVSRAMQIVDEAHPGYDAGSVNRYRGVFEVYPADQEAHPGFYGVDPGTGRITGHADPSSGFMAFMNQIHECFFTCERYPGYVGFLSNHVPTLGMHWLTDVSWAGFILGITGLLLVFLALSGIWLWWPGIKKWAHGFRIRWHKGRYARDYDLHQVIGMAAVPFLLVWGLTGAGFEFHWVNTAWYAATGGQQPSTETFASQPATDPKAPDIGMPAAITAARTLAGDASLMYAAQPAADDPTATYSFFFSKGFDQYRHGAFPGEYGVQVDRRDPARIHLNDIGHAATLSNQLLDSWGAPMFHYGQTVNGWWRLPWFLFGLSPLLLAATGISTWLAKRGVRKRRIQSASLAAGP